jgi:hypothetical protein
VVRQWRRNNPVGTSDRGGVATVGISVRGVAAGG